MVKFKLVTWRTQVRDVSTSCDFCNTFPHTLWLNLTEFNFLLVWKPEVLNQDVGGSCLLWMPPEGSWFLLALASASILQLSHIVQVLRKQRWKKHISVGVLCRGSLRLQTSRKRKLWVMLLSTSIHWPWEGLATALGLKSDRTAIYIHSLKSSQGILLNWLQGLAKVQSLWRQEIFSESVYIWWMHRKCLAQGWCFTDLSEREEWYVMGRSTAPSLEVMGRSRRREQKFIRVSVPIGLEAHSHIHASLACMGGPSSLKFITWWI